MTRLSPEREAEIRRYMAHLERMLAGAVWSSSEQATGELLAELDAVREERDEARKDQAWTRDEFCGMQERLLAVEAERDRLRGALRDWEREPCTRWHEGCSSESNYLCRACRTRAALKDTGGPREGSG